MIEFNTSHDETQYISSLEFIDIIPSELHRIADIGSGPGYQAFALQQKGHDVVCVDYVKPSVPDLSVAWYHPDRCNLSNLDAVWSHHALEHVRDPIGTLIKWRSYLKPNGSLLLTVPEIGTTMSSGHINNFNLPTLVYILAVSGYTTVGKMFTKSRSHLRAWVTRSEEYNPEEKVITSLQELANRGLFPPSIVAAINETGRFDNSHMHFSWNNQTYQPVKNSKLALEYVSSNMWHPK